MRVSSFDKSASAGYVVISASGTTNVKSSRTIPRNTLAGQRAASKIELKR